MGNFRLKQQFYISVLHKFDSIYSHEIISNLLFKSERNHQCLRLKTLKKLVMRPADGVEKLLGYIYKEIKLFSSFFLWGQFCEQILTEQENSLLECTLVPHLIQLQELELVIISHRRSMHQPWYQLFHVAFLKKKKNGF